MDNNRTNHYSVARHRTAIREAQATMLRIFIQHAERYHGHAQERLANVLWLWDHGLEHVVHLNCPSCYFIYRWLVRFDNQSIQLPE